MVDIRREGLDTATPILRGKPFPGMAKGASMTLTRSPLRQPVKEAKPAKGPRTVKCKARGCMNRFVRDKSQPFISWCSVECGSTVALERLASQKAKTARADRATKKLERAADKSKLEQHKPLAYWLAKVEKVCNEYIRARDPNVCISCGVTDSSAWQAGHYISVGANGTLRFNEDNIHKQCIHCNMFKGSNATNYRIGLLEKIGVARVEALEAWHPPVKLTREACEELETYYKAKLRALTNSGASR